MAKTCVNFSKKCGGCPLLALPYPRQTAEKQQRLQKLLGGFAPVAPLRTMAEPWHYRNKAIASFATQQGKLVCGLYAEGTHKVLPSADCLLQNEVLNRTLAAVQDAARACRYTAFDEDKRPACCATWCCAAPARGRCWSHWSRRGRSCPAAVISARICAKKRRGSSVLCKISTPL